MPTSGGFPVARSTVVIVPTLAEGDASTYDVAAVGGVTVVVELARSKIETRALYDEYQWVLLDGFINLGLPDKFDSWLSEGLTIYLEPIVSYRAGWRSADFIWEEWTSLLRDGVEPLKKGLEDSDSYWAEHCLP